MYSDTFVQGLRRVLNCSKVQVAATGLATTFLAFDYGAADLPPAERSALWVAFIGAVAVQLREIINAWTEEDVARVMQASLGPTVHLPQSDTAAPVAPSAVAPASGARVQQPTAELWASATPASASSTSPAPINSAGASASSTSANSTSTVITFTRP